MNLTTFTFSSSNDLPLFARIWRSPRTQPKGIIHLVHGLGEHSGRYAHLAETLGEAGYHVASFDLPGHGLSKGKRGYSPGLDQILDDIQIFIQIISEKIGHSLPNYLYGHSLGGNFTTCFGLRKPDSVSAMVVTSPVFQTTSPPPKNKVRLARVMSKVMPGFTLKNGLEIEALSRNKAVVKAYRDDVYVHDKISAQLGMDLLISGQFALENSANWKLPLLLVHGSADRISSHLASEQFAQSANGQVNFHLFKDYYHEIHNDMGSEAFSELLISWLDQQTIQ